ncbi:WXG100 family type VII secretion target, partial [Streptomyces xiamenensis]|uniref:WXG100 family type VII secretion target n=1 Tax=Streptomyces xiamenensis TaxID=408015 RepID=UPI0035D534B9
MQFEDLENASHEQLAALLAGANPDALIQRGDTLQNAARAVSQVGAAVAHHMRNLEWEGESATALREWVTRFEQDSDHFKSYTKVIGQAMKGAGQALKEAVSSMPPVPADTALPDSASQQAFGAYLGPAATSEHEQLRQEAIGVISRVGQVYQVASTIIRTVPEPHFMPLEVGDPWGPGSDRPSPSALGGGDRAGIPQSVPQEGRADSSPSTTQNHANTVPVDSVAEAEPGLVTPPIGATAGGGVGTSLDSVGVVPNGGAPPVAPSAPPAPVVERPVGGGPPQQPVVGPVPGWPSPAQPGQGRGGGGQVPLVRGPGLRPGEAPVVRPLGPPSGPGPQPPAMGRPAPAVPGGQQPPVGRPPTGGGGPGGGNPWGRANNYGLLGGKPVPNAKPTVASRIPPGGVIQPGMNAANS